MPLDTFSVINGRMSRGHTGGRPTQDFFFSPLLDSELHLPSAVLALFFIATGMQRSLSFEDLKPDFVFPQHYHSPLLGMESEKSIDRGTELRFEPMTQPQRFEVTTSDTWGPAQRSKRS